MRTRTLGSLVVPVVGVGCNNFGRRIDAAQAAAVVRGALDAGASFFDTADVYGDGLSEEYLGAALAGRRDDAVVASKFGMAVAGDPARSGAHPDYARSACEDSLRRLATDRIDLYQLHTPDESVPLAETLGALTELRDAGKVVEIGCSNFSAAQVDEARALAADGELTGFVSVQNHWSLLHREPETTGVVDACVRHGIGILPYYPLAMGLLTGKYRRGAPPPEGTRLALAPAEQAEHQLSERNHDIVDALVAFCAERGRTLLELAFSWLVAQPVVSSVIAGASTAEQVRANADAAGWELSDEELTEIDRLAPGEDTR